MIWDDLVIKECYRADMIVDHKVIVELKSVERLLLVHKKQLLTYLRITGCKLGLLVNFGAGMMKDGIMRVVNGLEEDEGEACVRESGGFFSG
jgi:GxxExxY protein